jgi:hypothetical protein
MKYDLCFGFANTKWKALSEKLDGDESAWAQALGVFERRMRERFFSSIDALIAADTKPDLQPSHPHSGHCIPGFSIMALCCLLIETLQGFQENVPAAADPVGPCPFPSGPCIKPPSGSNQKFITFLRRPAFGGAFNGKVVRSFVSDIRNGIIHEAETRRWVIWRDKPTGKIAAKKETGYALNRSLFYEVVKKEFDSYLQELRDGTDRDLRKRFKEKMDKLSRTA